MRKWIQFFSVLLIAALFLLLASCDKSKSPFDFDQETHGQWETVYGDSLNDTACCVEQTDDGSYIVAGKKNGYVIIDEMFQIEKSDMLIMKIDRKGSIVWDLVIPSGIARSVIQTTDGCLIAGGKAENNENIIKLSTNGDAIWQKTTQTSIHSIKEVSNNGFVAAGTHTGQIIVTKINTEGDIIWEKAYGYGQANSIDVTDSCEFIVAAGNGDGLIIKLDELGNKEWEYRFGGDTNDAALSIQQTIDTGYIAAGHADLDGSGTKMYVLKLDAYGGMEWDRTLDGASVNSIKQTGDGGYILAGWDWDSGARVIRLDQNGVKLWDEKLLTGTAFSIIETDDSHYVVVGEIRIDWENYDAFVKRMFH
jgi:hypothetical protein